MHDPHTFRVWSAVTFITLGVAEILVVSTIYAMKRQLSLALDQFARGLPGRHGMSALSRLVYRAGLLAVRHTWVAYALGLFSILLGAVILVLDRVYGG
jgi:heme exporter protein D